VKVGKDPEGDDTWEIVVDEEVKKEW